MERNHDGRMEIIKERTLQKDEEGTKETQRKDNENNFYLDREFVNMTKVSFV